MIVISDSGPIIHLSMVGLIDLIPEFFQEVLVPRAVYREVVEVGAGLPGSVELQTATWAKVVEPDDASLTELLLLGELDPGEAAALALAVSRRADQVLVDDLQARRAAKRLRLPTIGTLGILLAAKQRGRIPLLAPVLESLRRQGFWLSPALEREVLLQAGEVPQREER